MLKNSRDFGKNKEHNALKLEPTDSKGNLHEENKNIIKAGKTGSFFNSGSERAAERLKVKRSNVSPQEIAMSRDMIKTLYKFSKLMDNREVSQVNHRSPHVVDLTPRDSVPSVIPKMREGGQLTEYAKQVEQKVDKIKREDSKLRQNQEHTASLQGLGLVPETTEGDRKVLKPIGIGAIPQKQLRRDSSKNLADLSKERRIVIDKQLLEVIQNPDSEELISKANQTFYAGAVQKTQTEMKPAILIERKKSADYVSGEVGVNTDFQEMHKRVGFQSVSPPLGSQRRHYELNSVARLVPNFERVKGRRMPERLINQFNQTVRGFGCIADLSPDLNEQWHELITQYEGHHKLKNRTAILQKKLLDKSYMEQVKKYLKEKKSNPDVNLIGFAPYQSMEVRGVKNLLPKPK